MNYQSLTMAVRTKILTLAIAALSASPISAAPVTFIPVGLNPGDTYHLVFVTSMSRNATSVNINDYDMFAQGAADAAGIGTGSPIGNINWRVIGSTSTVDAIAHTTIQGGAYRLDGVKIASGEQDFWDGIIDAPITVNEFGVIGHIDPMVDANSVIGPRVFVGTTLSGGKSTGHELGSLNGVSVSRLFSTIGPGECVLWGDDLGPKTNSFYAISETLTVVPEPATLPLLLLALVGTRISKVKLCHRNQ